MNLWRVCDSPFPAHAYIEDVDLNEIANARNGQAKVRINLHDL
ncbi:MAG: hypothetical protein ACKVOY_19640 [Burkholderiaceae bacterium]